MAIAALAACALALQSDRLAPRIQLGVQTPAQWHSARRRAILREHPGVERLQTRDTRTLPVLAAVNAAQWAASITAATSDLPAAVLVPAGLLVGGTLSLWQFALLHDVKHGTAVLPRGVKKDDVLFLGALPSLFGYYLYLRHGHLTHHADFGSSTLATLFDSERTDFEDGDALFVAHRQSLPGDAPDERPGFFGASVGGLGISISRSIYGLLWSDHLGWAYNLLLYSFSMTFERAALCCNDKAVALTGRNAFFPHKPQPFHDTCATFARVNALTHLALLALAGPKAIAWLFLAEIGWQLPVHPACAMFVSNHPSLETPGGGCQPTGSIYVGAWYDWLTAFSNFHTEHHDFPDVPMWRLRELRDEAAPFYAEDAIAGARDGIVPTLKRCFAGRQYYACSLMGMELDK